ncbi:hypothetical protein CHS0354_013687 [Potamilus streckersoni]|uniref:Uncharacterized protein n=1 Tax=Potamilus streckersoni TaxID=2493646 RepID=A0AAE0VI11_9BIVA|nr:hypothetical protein CHS0354_013687 [Potamilus streckersoni]
MFTFMLTVTLKPASYSCSLLNEKWEGIEVPKPQAAEVRRIQNPFGFHCRPDRHLPLVRHCPSPAAQHTTPKTLQSQYGLTIVMPKTNQRVFRVINSMSTVLNNVKKMTLESSVYYVQLYSSDD